MQITLNQDEILEALEAYVRNQINLAPNMEIEIDLKAGRGENGYSATLDIRPANLNVRNKKSEPKPTLKNNTIFPPFDEIDEENFSENSPDLSVETASRSSNPCTFDPPQDVSDPPRDPGIPGMSHKSIFTRVE